MERPLTVAEFTDAVRAALSGRFPAPVWVEGEVEEARESHGHLFLTLADPAGDERLSCAVWRNRRRYVAALETGRLVKLFGSPDYYGRRGELRFIVELGLGAGEGELVDALRALKEKLAAEGLFAEERKRPLPALVHTLALVTSPAGAAKEDVLKSLEGSGVSRVLLFGTRVQGEDAPGEIVAALGRAGASEAELVILSRGGGGAEDLSAFNDEGVVRGVAACTVPVVSAVGHEIDITLTDLAADARAHTPTAAGELVANGWRRYEERLERLSAVLYEQAEGGLSRAESALSALALDLLRSSPGAKAEREIARIQALTGRGRAAVSDRLAQSETRLASVRGKVDALSPGGTLARGFAVVMKDGRRLLRSADAAEGESLDVALYEGSLEAEVKEVRGV